MKKMLVLLLFILGCNGNLTNQINSNSFTIKIKTELFTNDLVKYSGKDYYEIVTYDRKNKNLLYRDNFGTLVIKNNNTYYQVNDYDAKAKNINIGLKRVIGESEKQKYDIQINSSRIRTELNESVRIRNKYLFKLENKEMVCEKYQLHSLREIQAEANHINIRISSLKSNLGGGIVPRMFSGSILEKYDMIRLIYLLGLGDIENLVQYYYIYNNLVVGTEIYLDNKILLRQSIDNIELNPKIDDRTFKPPQKIIFK